MKECRDCKAEGRTGPKLNAPYQGPRCWKHHHEFKRAQRDKQAANRRTRTYGLSAAAYELLLAEQGHACAWCRRPVRKGGKRLSVDHDHKCCPGHTSCGECVRGLLCWSCNKALQHFGDSPLLIEQGALYLRHPPAKVVLGSLP